MSQGIEKEQEETTEINEMSFSGHRATKVKPIAGHRSSPMSSPPEWCTCPSLMPLGPSCLDCAQIFPKAH